MAAAMAEWKGVCWVPRVVARRDDTMVAQLVYSKGECSEELSVGT